MATMEPPATMEEEFQDWYDTEHFPERQNFPGFETAARWVCVDGWPRWLATYDLESVDALQTPQYLSSNGERASPWSKRILSRLSGRRRVVATQIAPGNELCLPPEKVSRLLLALYPSASLDPKGSAPASSGSGSAQLRYFRAPGETWLLAALRGPSSRRMAATYGSLNGCGASLFNLYAPYRRADAPCAPAMKVVCRVSAPPHRDFYICRQALQSVVSIARVTADRLCD